MKKKYKVSIVIPVFNMEKYLEQCLDSVLNQTLDSYEVIVVDDGSNDSSASIVMRYLKNNNSSFKFYQKDNGGLGSARNVGIEMAEGEFVGFVDSDDWIAPHMFEHMYNKCISESLECVNCDIICVDDITGEQWDTLGFRGQGEILNQINFMRNSMNPSFAWNKLFKAELFDIIKFPNIWYEDVATIPILFSYANSIGYLAEPLYYYRQRGDSITGNYTDKRNLDIIKAWDRCLDKCSEEFFNEMVYAVYLSICNFISFKKEFSRDYLEYARNHRELFKANLYIKECIEKKIIKNIFE